jgi:hypothetical protein
MKQNYILFILLIRIGYNYLRKNVTNIGQYSVIQYFKYNKPIMFVFQI